MEGGREGGRGGFILMEGGREEGRFYTYGGKKGGGEVLYLGREEGKLCILFVGK